MLEYAPFDETAYPIHGRIAPMYTAVTRQKQFPISSNPSHGYNTTTQDVDGWYAPSIASSMPVDRLSDDVHLMASQQQYFRQQKLNSHRNGLDPNNTIDTIDHHHTSKPHQEDVIGTPPSVTFGGCSPPIVHTEPIITDIRSPKEAILLATTYGVLGIALIFMFDHVFTVAQTSVGV